MSLLAIARRGPGARDRIEDLTTRQQTLHDAPRIVATGHQEPAVGQRRGPACGPMLQHVRARHPLPVPGVEHLDGADGRPPRDMVWIDTTAHGVELAGIVHVHALIVHVHGEQAQRRGDALVRPVGSGLVDAKEVIEHYAARAVESPRAKTATEL